MDDILKLQMKITKVLLFGPREDDKLSRQFPRFAEDVETDEIT